MESSKLRRRGFVPMLLQTNSYIVPREKRVEHARLLRRFRQTLMRLGCDHFEVYEQNRRQLEFGGQFRPVRPDHAFSGSKAAITSSERRAHDPAAQALLKEFCELINLPYQQQQGLFAVGFYTELHADAGVSSARRRHAAKPRIDQAGQSDVADSSSVPDASATEPANRIWIEKEPPILNQRSIPIAMLITPHPAEFQPFPATKAKRRRIPPSHPVLEVGINGIAKTALGA